MLTIERRAGSSVLIGKDIRVRVSQIRSLRAVRLTIEAPGDINIAREELVIDEAGQQHGDRRDVADHPKREFRIAVIEDDEQHAKLISRVLFKQGVHDVDLIGRGDEALEMIRAYDEDEERELPNLIMLDLHLPGANGLTVLDAIQASARLKSVPVVVLSSSEDEEDLRHAMASGARAFVTKSTDYKELKQSVRRTTEFWMITRRPE